MTKIFLEALNETDLLIRHKKLSPRGPVGMAICGYFIWFDSRHYDFFRIVVHELIHHVWPKMKEKEVERLEGFYSRTAPWSQKKKLLQAIIDNT